MSQFNLVAQLQLRSPRDAKRVADALQKQFAAIDVPIRVRTNDRAIRRTSTAIGLVDTESIRANKSATALGNTLGIAARRFGAISIATGTFLRVIRAFKNSTSAAIDFERELNKIRQVTGATAPQIRAIADEVSRLSTSLGVNSGELILASRTLAQAGFNAKSASGALQVLAQTDLAATFDSIKDTTEGAVAVLQQFGRESLKAGNEVQFLEQSLSAINSVSKKFAVESGDIISAIRKTGGSFEAAGGSLNELIALFTSVRATTRESADTIATSFRTIFTRLQRTETIDALRELGITLQDTEGKFIGPLKAIEAISAGLSVLDTQDFRFSQIVENLGGFRQIGKVIPLIQQYAITQDALNVAQNSGNSLAKDSIVAQDALAIQIAKTREQFDALVRTITQGETFKKLAKDALIFANAMIKLVEAIEPLLPYVLALGAVKFAPTVLGALGAGGTRRSAGGPVHFATGGVVPGIGNTDSVSAMLEPGSFVLRKSATKKLGFANGGLVPAMVMPGERIFSPEEAKAIGYGNLDRMNKFATGGTVGMSLPRFEKGGTVSRPSASLSPGQVSQTIAEIQSFGYSAADAGDILDSLVEQIDEGVDSMVAFRHATNKANKRRQERQIDLVGKPQSPDDLKKLSAEAAKTRAGFAAASQKLLLVAGGAGIAASQLGLLSGESTKLVAQMATVGGAVYAVGSGLLQAAEGPLSKLDTKLANTGNKFGRSIAKMGGVANIAQGALVGLAVAAAAAQYYMAQLAKEQQKSQDAFDNKVKGLSEGKDVGLEALSKDLVRVSELEAKATGARNAAIRQGTVGAVGGAISGAAIGTAIAPVIGTAIGAAIGGAIGGGIGGFGGAYAGDKDTELADPLIRAAEASAKSQYTAIKATYDFTNAMEQAKIRGLSSFAKLDTLSSGTNDLSKALSKAKSASIEFERSLVEASGYSEVELTKTQKDQRENNQTGIADLTRLIKENQVKVQSQVVANSGEFLSNTDKNVSFDQLLKAGGVGKVLDDLRQSFVQTNVPLDEQVDRITSVNQALLDQVTAHNKNVNTINAQIAARQAEIEIILRTNAALNSMVESTRQFDAVGGALDRLTGFVNGNSTAFSISTQGLDDLAKVGDIGSFANSVNSISSVLGSGGQKIGKQVVNAADAIQKLQVGLNASRVNQLKSSLGSSAGNAPIEEFLKDIIGPNAFAGLDSELKKQLIAQIKGAGGPNEVGQSEIDSIISSFASSAQKQAAVLQRTVELSNKYLSEYDKITSAIISAQNKELESRQKLVDVQSKGFERNVDANKGRLGELDLDKNVETREKFRTRRAQVGLTQSGGQAGNVRNVSSILRRSQAQFSRNDAKLSGGSLDPKTIASLNTAQSALTAQSNALRSELERLADQSSRASDILGQIDRERSKREFASGQVEDFILGGKDERKAQVSAFQGANVVARTGSFQGLSEELRKPVADLLKNIADLEPGGVADNVRRKAIFNDSVRGGIPPQLAAALANNKATSKEDKLIQDLKALNAQEQAAQQALINADMQNTQALNNLVPAIQNLINTLATNFNNANANQNNIRANQDANFANKPVVNNSKPTIDRSVIAKEEAIKNEKIRAELAKEEARRVQFRSDGGSIFQSRGTDTVPAMLTPGEYVVKKSAVDKLGTQFMDQVNQGQAPQYRARGGMINVSSRGQYRLTPQIVQDLQRKYLSLSNASISSKPSTMVQKIGQVVNDIQNKYKNINDVRLHRYVSQLNLIKKRYAGAAKRNERFASNREKTIQRRQARRRDNPRKAKGFATGGSVSSGYSAGTSGGSGSGIAEAMNQFNQAFSSNMSSIIQSLNQVGQSFNNIHMTHEVNVNGQLALPGLDSDRIANEVMQSLGDYVVNKVNQQLSARDNSLRTG